MGVWPFPENSYGEEIEMKILIRGGGFQNKGAEAMLRVVQRELGVRLSEASFYATVTPLDAPFTYRSGISVVDSPNAPTKILRTLPIASKIYQILLSFRNSNFARAVKISPKAAFEINAMSDVDAVIDVSGFAYGDTWPQTYLKNAWAWVEYCRLIKKPESYSKTILSIF